jgi:hypothetical protein
MAQWRSGDQHGKMEERWGKKLVVRMSFHHKSYMTSPGSKSRLCFENTELWESLTHNSIQELLAQQDREESGNANKTGRVRMT